VEVLDEAGPPVPGYRREEARAVMGNGVQKEVHWQAPLGDLSGKPVRFCFEMRDARLYAFQVAI
jgi:hypothetical protein